VQKTNQFLPNICSPCCGYLKMLDKIIANQLSAYLKEHQLLHDHQDAYQCSHTLEQILLHAIGVIVDSLVSGAVVCAAFLDLQKGLQFPGSCDFITASSL